MATITRIGLLVCFTLALVETAQAQDKPVVGLIPKTGLCLANPQEDCDEGLRGRSSMPRARCGIRGNDHGFGVSLVLPGGSIGFDFGNIRFGLFQRYWRIIAQGSFSQQSQRKVNSDNLCIRRARYIVAERLNLYHGLAHSEA